MRRTLGGPRPQNYPKYSTIEDALEISCMRINARECERERERDVSSGSLHSMPSVLESRYEWTRERGGRAFSRPPAPFSLLRAREVARTASRMCGRISRKGSRGCPKGTLRCTRENDGIFYPPDESSHRRARGRRSD